MADHEEEATTESAYVQELNARHERFKALGGNIDLQMEMKGWTPLKDLVTDLHRKIVFDLAASGLSNEIVADVIGISKERLQSLFKLELATAYGLCHASMSRSLYAMALSGNEKAATNWLQLHNLSKWRRKTSIEGVDGAAPIKTEEVGSSRGIITDLIKGMMTNQEMKGSSKKVDKPDTKVDNVSTGKSAPKKSKTIRKVRSENEEATPVETVGRVSAKGRVP